MSVGYFAISFHKLQMEQKVHKNVSEICNKALANGKSEPIDIDKLVMQERGKIAQNKSFYERYFSFKTFHGVAFGISYWQMIGRIFFSKQDENYKCWTYPAYKLATSDWHNHVDGDGIQYISAEKPGGSPLTKSSSIIAIFGVGNILGPMLIGLIIAFL